MYNKVISFLLITLCTFSSVCSAATPKTSAAPPAKHAIGKKHAPDKVLHKKCLYPTVKVTDLDGTSGGSGFIVRSTKVGSEWHNVVVGTAHTVECERCEPEDLWVHVAEYEDWSTIKGYKKYPLTIYARNNKRDLSIGMFTSKEKMPIAEMCFDAKLYLNTNVFHIGCGLLDDPRIDYGQVTSPKTVTPKMFEGLIRTNVYTFMGDSGGPLFLKDNYKVIGVCDGIRSYRGMALPNISYYRPITELKTWDGELNNALESVYNEAKALPVIPFVRLKLKGYKITE